MELDNKTQEAYLNMTGEIGWEIYKFEIQYGEKVDEVIIERHEDTDVYIGTKIKLRMEAEENENVVNNRSS